MLKIVKNCKETLKCKKKQATVRKYKKSARVCWKTVKKCKKV